jgi:hypothetical protein
MPAKFEKVEDRIHTFPYRNKDRTLNKGPFLCTDEVYVLDSTHLDHLSVDDEHNEGIYSHSQESLTQFINNKPRHRI